jgi:hypothetical protein
MYVLGVDGSRIVLQVKPPSVAVGSEQVGSDGARECTGQRGETRRPIGAWVARSVVREHGRDS